MVLTASDLGIKDTSLIPFFCCQCGDRIGWSREQFGEENAQVYCESCAKNQEVDYEGDSDVELSK